MSVCAERKPPLVILSLVLAVVLAAPARSPADFAVLQGRTLILTRTNNAVAIVLDTNYDGYADELFWFRAEVVPTLRVFSERSSVIFSGDELVVTSADTGEAHVFSVGRPRISVHKRDDISSSSAYAGYGLSHKMGAYLNGLRVTATTATGASGRLQTQSQVGTLDCNSNPDSCILNPDEGGGGAGGSNCESGGVGAIQCSITQTSGAACACTCATGYYACCVRNVLNPPTCTCVHN